MLSPLERASPGDLPELMDNPGCDTSRLRDALHSIALSNRLFGGHRLVWWGVRRFLEGRPPGAIHILDVGTGSADIPRHLDRRLRARGWRPHFVLADLHATTLRIAREEVGARLPRFTFVRLDGARLPFADGYFDLALSSTTLHHLERDRAVRLFSELARVSDGQWLVTDLRRSRLTLALVRLAALALWHGANLARRDGPVSVRRAFTPREIESLLRAAGVDGGIQRAGPVRLLAAGRAA